VLVLLRIVVNAAAIALAAAVIPGIRVSGTVAALIAGIVFGLVNAIVRPILIVLTLPITLVTLGLFIFVLNAICFWLTSMLVPGFDVRGFWPAFLGALLVSVVSWIVNAVVRERT
jgi:putative membrane protein